MSFLLTDVDHDEEENIITSVPWETIPHTSSSSDSEFPTVTHWVLLLRKSPTQCTRNGGYNQSIQLIQQQVWIYSIKSFLIVHTVRMKFYLLSPVPLNHSWRMHCWAILYWTKFYRKDEHHAQVLRHIHFRYDIHTSHFWDLVPDAQMHRHTDKRNIPLYMKHR